MDFIKDNWGMLVSFAGVAVMWGVFKTKLKQHDIEIRDIKNRQNTNDKLLSDIVKQLTELNTKMDLIVGGKLKQEE